jgi:hypothetical protein
MVTSRLAVLMSVCAALSGSVACTGSGESTRARTTASVELPANVDAAARQTFSLFTAWLEALNSGDRRRYLNFVKKKFPSRTLMAELDMRFLRRVTGGFDLRKVTSVSSTEVRGLLQERITGRYAEFVLFTGIDVPGAYGSANIGQPHIITDLQIRRTSRPASTTRP